MNPQDYIKKIEKTQEYRDFAKQNPDAYLCSMFLVRDFEGEHNETQIDFYSPKTKKITVFKVNGKVEKVPEEKKPIDIKQKKFVPKELIGKIGIDIDAVSDIILDEMHNRGMTDQIKKLLIVLQTLEGKTVWNCTCFLSGLNLLQTHVEDESKSVLFMEKKSFMDMIIPLKPGEKIDDALKKKREEKDKFDIEKTEGKHQGFIG